MIGECGARGMTVGNNCHLLQLRQQQQEESRKGEIMRGDLDFQQGKCSVTAARPHRLLISSF